MLSIMRTVSLASLLLLSFNPAVLALPIAVRQDSSPVTVTTHHTTTTPVGPMVQTCVVTLTPITDSNGNPAVEEVSKCTMAPANGESNNNSNSNSNSGSDSTQSTQSAEAPPAISVNGFNTVTAASSSTAATSVATSVITSASSTQDVISSASSSSVTESSPNTESTSVASDSGNGGNNNGSNTSTDSSNGGNAAQTAGSDQLPGASAEAAQVTATATAALAAAAVPGKSLNVLPIGLGVFAGISVIALIVVGLVTYERTKYRKAFRQRKLAESGAAMGYGGMATRS